MFWRWKKIYTIWSYDQYWLLESQKTEKKAKRFSWVPFWNNRLQVLTKSYIRDSLAKLRLFMAWLQNLMRSRICVYLMFQWLKTILIWCISKTLRLKIDYQTSVGFSQKSKFCYFLQISLPNSLRICLQNKPKL